MNEMFLLRKEVDQVGEERHAEEGGKNTSPVFIGVYWCLLSLRFQRWPVFRQQKL